MSDPQRLPDICAAASTLPKGSALIYRHFGADDRRMIADSLRQIAFSRDLQFLIGKDARLAKDCGADGVHLPEADIARAALIHASFQDWLITGAAHSGAALAKAASFDLDAAILSPVFASQSPSAGRPLGIDTFAGLAKSAPLPVFALGGIHAGNAKRLIGSGTSGFAGVSGIANG